MACSALRLLLRPSVLNPGHWDDEERGEDDAEQDVDPGQAEVVGAHAEAGDEGTEGAAEVLFHASAPDRLSEWLSEERRIL